VIALENCSARLVLLVTIAMALAAVAGAAGFPIVVDGKPAATIVPADTAPGSVAGFAARELRDYVSEISGVGLPIVAAAEAPAGPKILVGPSALTEQAGAAVEGLAPNGYVMKTAGDVLILAGRDGGRGNPRAVTTESGTLFAVYALLREHFGLRWVWPGALGEVIPKSDSLTAPDLDVRHEPRLLYCYYGGGFGIHSAAHLWQKRNGIGRKVTGVNVGHAFDWVITKENYETRPEAFATVKGKRVFGQQPCYNSAAFRELAAPRLREAIVRPGVIAVSFQPNDGGGFCDETCPDCGPHLVADASCKGGLFRTDALVAAWNKLAAEIGEIPAGRYYATRTYSVYRKPPRRVTPDPRLLIIRHQGSGSFRSGPTPEDREAIRRWTGGGKTPFLMDTHWWCVEDTPTVATVPLSERIAFWHGHSLRGFRCEAHLNWSAFGLMFYLGARLLQDPGATRASVLAEWYAAFGAAAPSIRELYERCEQAFAETTAAEAEWRAAGVKSAPRPASYHERVTAAEFATSSGQLLEAARAAASDATTRARVEYVAAGFEFARLLRRREAELFPLLMRAGWMPHHRTPYASAKPPDCALALPPLPEFKAAISKADEIGETFMRFWREHAADRSGVGPLPPYRTDDHAYLPRAPSTQRFPELQLRHLAAVLRRREVLAAPSEWLFRADGGQVGERERWFAPDLDEAEWGKASVCVPTKYQRLPKLGHVWYRQRFAAPAAARGKTISILFGGICMSQRVYVNGVQVRELVARNLPYANNPWRLAWRVPFELDVTEQVRFGVDNVVAVHVWNDFNVLGFWRPAFVCAGADEVPAPERRPEILVPVDRKKDGDL